MFGKKEYIFVICQDKVFGDDKEKQLKNEAFEYIEQSIKSYLFKRKIKFVDYYTSRSNLISYTLLSTNKNMSTQSKFIAFLYEMYAFTIKEDDRIFDCYKPEKKEFSNDNQTIRVYKFKIK